MFYWSGLVMCIFWMVGTIEICKEAGKLKRPLDCFVSFLMASMPLITFFLGFMA